MWKLKGSKFILLSLLLLLLLAAPTFCFAAEDVTITQTVTEQRLAELDNILTRVYNNNQTLLEILNQQEAESIAQAEQLTKYKQDLTLALNQLTQARQELDAAKKSLTTASDSLNKANELLTTYGQQVKAEQRRHKGEVVKWTIGGFAAGALFGLLH